MLWPSLIKNLKTHIFPTTQQNWLQATTSNKFTFNSDALRKYPVHHYTFPQINDFSTSNFSNYIIYMTSKPKGEVRILSRAHSFKESLMEKANNSTFLCLTEESNISYTIGYDLPMALLPFIISFISEGHLIGTANYIEYPYTFTCPIRDYVLIDGLPMYDIYVNFYNNFNRDLINLGYSPEDTKLIHYEVGKILSTLAFENKGNIYNIETSIKLFTHAWEYNNQVKCIR